MTEETFEVLRREKALDHPYVTVTMEQVRLPDGRVIDDWPIIDARDYVNCVVLNQQSEIMILEGYKHGLGRSSWQVVGGYLEAGEDPADAVRRELLEETGYASDEWEFLGSYVIDANRRVGKGWFYLARNARQVAEPDSGDLEAITIHWVAREAAQAALGDGRVGVVGYAVNLALALLRV